MGIEPGHEFELSGKTQSVSGTSRILDVGCGDGASLIVAGACRCKLVVGADIMFEAVLEAKRKLPWAHFVVARGDALPFKDTSFDNLICRVAIVLMPIVPALEEMRRVCRPEALVTLHVHDLRFALFDLWRSLRSPKLKSIVGRLWAILNGILFLLSGRNVKMPFTSPDHGWETWQTRGSMRRALKKAGFGSVKVPFVVRAKRL
jgi:ubiquinone/menaquinone biosynthesis C-methylase UbiE